MPVAEHSPISLEIVEVAVLSGHSDEVWNLEWSHDGSRLATASKDKTAAIWSTEPSSEYRHIASLSGHRGPVSQAAWSPDDTLLLTVSAECIHIWDTRVQTELCAKLEGHDEDVSRVLWLPDGSGFISGGLDRKIIRWSTEGEIKESWTSSLLITDIAINPDATRLFAHGRASFHNLAWLTPSVVSYDLTTKDEEFIIHFDSASECTGLELSRDARHLLLNNIMWSAEPSESYAEVVLLDTLTKEVDQRFSGHTQSVTIIRCCFVGADDQVIASGSQDGNVCVWDRKSGTLLKLSGHGSCCVSGVACNPANKNMFASCSDDNTVRVWKLND